MGTGLEPAIGNLIHASLTGWCLTIRLPHNNQRRWKFYYQHFIKVRYDWFPKFLNYLLIHFQPRILALLFACVRRLSHFLYPKLSFHFHFVLSFLSKLYFSGAGENRTPIANLIAPIKSRIHNHSVTTPFSPPGGSRTHNLSWLKVRCHTIRRQADCLVPPVGIEPTTYWLKASYSANWVTRAYIPHISEGVSV